MAKKEVVKKEYASIYIEELAGKKLMTVAYNTNSEDLEDEEFKDFHWNHIKTMVEQEKPTFGIADLREFLYTISPTMQTWIDTEMSTIYLQSIQKMAILMKEAPNIMDLDLDAEDLNISFENLAMEQLAQEKNSSQMQNQFFESEEEARKWFTV